ncbi:uncharacterized protein [Rutidosis leptorrhynchoides]|uniref:uncharacterized protein n=1 Tax=Rutidosis leptorrhynchoides TaxID=125765 RepID=UPI003A991294
MSTNSSFDAKINECMRVLNERRTVIGNRESHFTEIRKSMESELEFVERCTQMVRDLAAPLKNLDDAKKHLVHNFREMTVAQDTLIKNVMSRFLDELKKVVDGTFNENKVRFINMIESLTVNTGAGSSGGGGG